MSSPFHLILLSFYIFGLWKFIYFRLFKENGSEFGRFVNCFIDLGELTAFIWLRPSILHLNTHQISYDYFGTY